MTSHELARLLLARRDNDVRFLVVLDDGESDEYDIHTVGGRPDDADALMLASGRGPVFYDEVRDCIVIEAGVVYTGESEDE